MRTRSDIPLNFLVSVIVPVYNAERFVRRAVESAVSLAEVGEIILIDDAGPDNSLAVCQQLEKEFSKVKVVWHPDGGNHGAGASRNLGIEHARFEFISFLDADDYYLPNRFEKEWETFLNDESIDGVYGAIGIDYDSEQARKKFLEAGYAYQEFLTLSSPVPPEELIEVLFHCHPTVTGEFHTNSVTVRKSLFERSGKFNEKLRLRQDIHLWRRMAAAGRLVAGSIDREVANRGVHGANRMINQAEQAKYVDYWWEDLNCWFQSMSGISRKSRKAFQSAYCSYLLTNSPKWKRRWVFLKHVFQNPHLILRPMGFFDLNLFEVFGRNWLTLHFTSAKNRVLRVVFPLNAHPRR
ncbi:glycosyltransferase family 2 protein [Pseudomonadota bacterium]